jgi:hypothetical protein
MHYHAARTEQAEQAQLLGTATAVPVPVTSTRSMDQSQSRGAVDTARHPTQAPSSRGTRKGPRPRVSDDEVIAAIRQRQQNGPVSRRDLMAEFRMGTPRAVRLMAAARNGTQLDLTGIPDGNS